MKRKFFYRIVIQNSIIIVLAFTLFYFWFSQSYSRIFKERLTSNLRKTAILINDRINTLKHISQVDSLVKELGQKTGYRITVILDNGIVVGESDKPLEELGDHSDRPELLEARGKGYGSSERYSITVKKRLHYVAIRARILGNNGFVRISAYLDDLYHELHNIRSLLLKYALLLIILSIGLVYLLSLVTMKKLIRILLFIKRLKNKDFSARIEIEGNDEIAFIGKSLNQMAEILEKTILSLKTEHAELNNIINGIQEALCVIDKNDTIILSNKSFKRCFKFESPENKYYWEIIPNPNLPDKINQVRQEQSDSKIEFYYNNKVYEIHLNYLEINQSIICVFYDITERKELELIKKDFVSNVSHELKTPLTALKGYLENMEQDPESVKQFLPILHRNTDRLIHLVQDLLLLSSIEEKKPLLQKENINIKDIVKSLLPLFEKKLKEKNLEIRLKFPSRGIVFKGDKYLVEQLFINLLDNAIRYTDEGWIEIRGKKKTNRVEIEVEDTGIGIPKDLQERIFERFFVVNKARSRSTGGTGLGLSIVKHIVQLHNGKVEVESMPQKGSIFKIIFPL